MNPTSSSLAALVLAAIAFAAAVPSTVQAHHGQDFLLLEDYHLPAPGAGHIIGNFEWEKYADDDEFGLSPSFMLGVLPRVALSAEVSFRDEDGWDYNSVMPAAHFQITPPDAKFPLRIGLSVGYQFVSDSFADAHAAEDEHEEKHDHAEEHEHHDEHGDEHAEEHHGEDETTTGHSHTESSVHNHDSDALMSRLIVEGDFGATKAVFNLISLVRDGGDAGWGYAAGVRHKVVEKLALGVEALGDFESEGWHELVGGIYFEPVHSLTLKLGAGFGLTEETPDFTLRTGFIWRF